MLNKFFAVLAVLIGALNPSTFAQVAHEEGAQILEQVITSAGGREAIKKGGDFRATGSFSLYSGADVTETGAVELAGSGLKRFRLTATLEHETRIWVWKDGAGFLQAKDQKADPIGPHNVSALEGITFPILKIIALLDSHSNSIQFIETAIVDGREAYRIRITQAPREQKERLLLGRKSATTDILIDKQALSIIGLEDTIYPNGHLRESYQHSVVYGDYRSIDGVQVPFSIKEKISGQLTWELQLNSFSPGVSPGDSEFQLN